MKRDELKMRIPVVGDIVERSLSRFCRSFATMLKAGVALNQALTLYPMQPIIYVAAS